MQAQNLKTCKMEASYELYAMRKFEVKEYNKGEVKFAFNFAFGRIWKLFTWLTANNYRSLHHSHPLHPNPLLDIHQYFQSNYKQSLKKL